MSKALNTACFFVKPNTRKYGHQKRAHKKDWALQSREPQRKKQMRREQNKPKIRIRFLQLPLRVLLYLQFHYKTTIFPFSLYLCVPVDDVIKETETVNFRRTNRRSANKVWWFDGKVQPFVEPFFSPFSRLEKGILSRNRKVPHFSTTWSSISLNFDFLPRGISTSFFFLIPREKRTHSVNYPRIKEFKDV